MALRTPSTSVIWTGNVVATTTAETIFFTSAPVSPPVDSAQLVLIFNALVTLTGSTTAVTWRIRRGILVTSPLVNQGVSIPAAANTNISFNGSYADTPGIVTSQQYVLTFQATAAAANSTLVDGAFSVLVL